ncbi:hypothetical protein VTH82DRAFT_7770 [Thermothelomyces myriococcoides]
MSAPAAGSSPLSSATLTALGFVEGVSLLVPGSEEYERANGSYYSALESELRPSYIVRPASAEQVRALVEVLRPHAGTTTPVAIRCGGHTPFAGSANVQGGITIDLRDLKGVALSPDKSTVEIAAGEIWSSVYAELEKHGLTVAGGRVDRIGVSGFLLGGGLSYFSGCTGFACDSVMEFKIVLASGELVRASATENTDLWFALKGGLNNFGIVTSFTMKTIASREIWGGSVYYPPQAIPQMLQSACDFAQNEDDQDAHIMCSIGYGYGHLVAPSVLYHTEGKVNPPSLQRFTSVQPQIEQMTTLRTAPLTSFYKELSDFSKDGLRVFYASLTIKPDFSLMEELSDRWQATLETIKDIEGFIFGLTIFPLTKAHLQHSVEAGGNAMDILPSDGPLLILLINPSWTRPEDDNRVFAAVESLLANMRQLAAKRGCLHRYIYANYGYHKDDIMAGYGEKSLERLREVSRKYDPDGMFQRGIAGGFKLGHLSSHL